MSDYLLELNPTEPDRPAIKIDGETYHMAVPDDFEYGQFVALVKAGKIIQEYFAGDVAAKDMPAREQQIDGLARQVLHDVPEDVFTKLRAMHKLRLINLFSVAVETEAGTLRPDKAEPATSPS